MISKVTSHSKINDICNGLKLLEICKIKPRTKYKCECFYCKKVYLVNAYPFNVGKARCRCNGVRNEILTGKELGKLIIESFIKKEKGKGNLYACKCKYCEKKIFYFDNILKRKDFKGCKCNILDISISHKKTVYKHYIQRAKKKTWK